MVQSFARAGTFPDYGTLLASVTAALGSAQFVLICAYQDDGTKPVYVDKGSPWLPTEIAAVQAAVTSAPASPVAQIQVDALPLWAKALALALVDQLNVIRAALPVPLSAITPAQAIAAIRAKAGTL